MSEVSHQQDSTMPTAETPKLDTEASDDVPMTPKLTPDNDIIDQSNKTEESEKTTDSNLPQKD